MLLKRLFYLIVLCLMCPMFAFGIDVYGPFATSANITGNLPETVVTNNYYHSDVTVNNDVIVTGTLTAATNETINGIDINNAAVSDVTTFTSSDDMNVDSNTFFVDASENKVGIGTASPDFEFSGILLHIADTGGSNAGRLNITGGSGADNSGIGMISFSDPTDTDETLAYIFGRVSGSSTPAGGDLEFATQADGGAFSTRMIILSNGNVGINTTGPDRKFDVLDASNPQIRLTHTDGSVYTDLQTTSAGELYIAPSGTNVGIGTNDPDTLLTVSVSGSDNTPANLASASRPLMVKNSNDTNGTYSYVGFADSDAVCTAIGSEYTDTTNNYGDIFFWTRSASAGERARITSAGNLGIATTGPDRKLDVLDASNPQIRLTHTDGTVYTDLQTDSNGDYIIIPSGGDVTVSGNLTVNGTIDLDDSYGGIYGSDNASATTITTQNVWVTITEGATQYAASQNVTHASGVLTVSIEGDYNISYSTTFSGSNSDLLGVGISINDADPAAGAFKERTIGTAGALGNAGGSYIVSLSANDTVRLKTRNASDTDDITHKHWDFVLHRVGSQ